jgi:hypothetical protein
MYDIFYVSKTKGNDDDWATFKSEYPIAQRLTNVTSYEQIKSKAFTKMFWVVWDDLNLLKTFNLNNYRATKWDDMYVHVFKNGEHHDGVCLFPKSLNVSQKEFHHRFFTAKKEIEINASTPKKYNIYTPQSYDEYKSIEDEMFWCIWPEVEVTDESIFDLYFSHHNTYDRRENHIFKNTCNEVDSYMSGIVLCSRYKRISSREFEKQYLVDKKEYDVTASKFRYPRHVIHSYEQYLEILNNESQSMFWGIWPEIEIIDTTILDFYFDPNNKEYDADRHQNHMFKNLCNNEESYLNGLVLFSKEKTISKKEFSRRYLIEKKEHNKVVSRYRYPRYVMHSYEQYLEILNNESQKMFWGIWPEVEIVDQSIFGLYFDPRDWKEQYDTSENNTFKHSFNDKIISMNSPVLFSKQSPIGKREFSHRFLTNKKENDKVISKHKLYDVVFISYNEPNADENYQKLLDKCPRAKRVHSVKGIHRAHIKAAELSETDMLWIVDGDAIISNDFNFDLVYFSYSYDVDCVHVWSSRNPINGLEYGYGGVKLLPRLLTLNMDLNTADMTTSISKKFKSMNVVSNITVFNTDPFNTWKSAFRECAKLASKVIERQDNDETIKRLDTWCEVADGDYGYYAIAGALAGRAYGEQNKGNFETLKKINDFDWLREKFNAG